MATKKSAPLFTLDVDDARRVERLLCERSAIDAELDLIVRRSAGGAEPPGVVIGSSAERIVGGYPVGSVFVQGAGGCGIYDPATMECRPFPCEQVPAH